MENPPSYPSKKAKKAGMHGATEPQQKAAANRLTITVGNQLIAH
jgi:hypothetical protein